MVSHRIHMKKTQNEQRWIPFILNIQTHHIHKKGQTTYKEVLTGKHGTRTQTEQ